MNVNNLMDNVRDFFSEQYEGVEKSNSFLSFEALGTMIDPDDFKDENEEISEIKATEQLSILGDRLPEIDDIFLTNTSRLSSIYEILIRRVGFYGENIKADDVSPYLTIFAEAKKDAEFKYNEAVKASIERPEGNYLPVYGTPNKWYDPEGSFWQTKTFSETENKATPAPKSSSIKKTAVPFLWKTNLVANSAALSTSIIQEVKLKPILHSKPIKVNMATVASPIAARVKIKKRPFAIGGTKRVVRARPGRTTTVVPSRRGGTVRVRRGTSLKPTKPIPVKAAQVKSVAAWSSLAVLKHLDIAERTKMTSQIAHHNTAPQEPVRSNGFEMSFDYCIVNLERSWFDTTMFHCSKLWYGYTMEESYFSTGTKDEANSGALKCIPTAMILIKNLKLKAAWTNEDIHNAKNSIGLGIFNLSESTFSDNELTNSGMQIIGWMCEVLPKLPENSDPGYDFT
ncbi:hypothetical protein [Cellulophaga baltica]|uniref:hypothetical protein n=1 Tax=Cellulophaga baltica TaxID=76594 RepID=UPI00249550E5|nr:hypothetical protein [Cellulophaga baltica]